MRPYGVKMIREIFSQDAILYREKPTIRKLHCNSVRTTRRRATTHPHFADYSRSWHRHLTRAGLSRSRVMLVESTSLIPTKTMFWVGHCTPQESWSSTDHPPGIDERATYDAAPRITSSIRRTRATDATEAGWASTGLGQTLIAFRQLLKNARKGGWKFTKCLLPRISRT